MSFYLSENYLLILLSDSSTNSCICQQLLCCSQRVIGDLFWWNLSGYFKRWIYRTFLNETLTAFVPFNSHCLQTAETPELRHFVCFCSRKANIFLVSKNAADARIHKQRPRNQTHTHRMWRVGFWSKPRIIFVRCFTVIGESIQLKRCSWKVLLSSREVMSQGDYHSTDVCGNTLGRSLYPSISGNGKETLELKLFNEKVYS